MERRAHIVQVGHLGICDGEFRVVNRRKDAIRQKNGNRGHRRLSKDHQRSGDSRFAQRDSFGNRGDGKIFRARIQGHLRHRHCTVAVGIRLHDGKQTSTLGKMMLGLKHVMANSTKVDFDPSPTLVGFRNGIDLVHIEWDRFAAI